MAERRDTRVTAGVGVILTINGKPSPCMTRNLSRGGIFAVTRERPPEGTLVDLEVVHQGSRLKAQARVVKLTERGLGLSFVNVGEDFRTAVRSLMDNLVADHSVAPGLVELDDFDDYELRMAWAPPGEEGWWKFWKKRRHAADIGNLSLDGAALRSDLKPEVGAVVVVFIEGKEDKAGQPLGSEAEVVRHTDEGFAVKFISPSIDFRGAISEARRSKFRGG